MSIPQKPKTWNSSPTDANFMEPRSSERKNEHATCVCVCKDCKLARSAEGLHMGTSEHTPRQVQALKQFPLDLFSSELKVSSHGPARGHVCVHCGVMSHLSAKTPLPPRWYPEGAPSGRTCLVVAIVKQNEKTRARYFSGLGPLQFGMDMLVLQTSYTPP